MLLRKLFDTPISTPGAALYLESGTVPIHLIMKAKRIMYFHHILTRSREALTSQALWAQIEKPGKGDWYLVVAEDIKLLGLHDILTIEKIQDMSKETLKDLLKKHVRKTAYQELNAKKLSLTKISNLHYDTLNIQPYLLIDIPRRLKRILFKWRTRMIKVGWNYGSKSLCPLCQGADDTQEHLLQCTKLNDNITDIPTHDITDPTFLRRIGTILRKRAILLEKKPEK